jgi:hypothetical protein
MGYDGRRLMPEDIEFYISGVLLTAIIIFGIVSLAYLVISFIAWSVKKVKGETNGNNS